MDLEIGVAARGCAYELVIEDALASSVGFHVFLLSCVVGFVIGSLGFLGFVIGLVLLYLKGALHPLLSLFFTQQFVCAPVPRTRSLAVRLRSCPGSRAFSLPCLPPRLCARRYVPRAPPRPCLPETGHYKEERQDVTAPSECTCVDWRFGVVARS